MRLPPVLLTFLAAAALLGWLQRHPSIADSDAWYHLKMAELTAASGPVREFPWLPFTTLADAYADHHFLYHVLLAGFVSVLGPFPGGKAVTVLLGAAAVAAFHALLRDRGVRHAWAWAFLSLSSQGFLFRISLLKAVAPALALLFLALILLRRAGGARRLGARPLRGLFLLSFAFVWLYGGWPVLLVVLAAWSLGRFVERRFSGNGPIDWTIVPVVLGGVATGLVINPFFPANLAFYKEQILGIAVRGRADPLVGVGAEWYPLDPGLLFTGIVGQLIAVAAGLGLVAALISWKGVARPGAKVEPRRAGDIVTALVLAVAFFLLTLRQARQQEYLVPFLTLFAALLFDTAARLVDREALFDAVGRRLRSCRAAVAGLGLAALAAAVLVWISTVTDMSSILAERPAFARYAGAGEWLKANVPSDEVVFHSRWDDFPLLFLHDGTHRYVAGLDARFLHANDPERYWLWRDVSEGRRREGLADLLKEEFGAETVFLRAEGEALKPLIEKDPSFERVYADSEAEIWRVKSTTMRGLPSAP